MAHTRTNLALTAGAALLTGVVAAAPAHAQVTIDPDHKFSWGENAGWINWGPQGLPTAAVASTYLHGKLWGENIGWISLGNTPADGIAYTNASGSDYGLNYDSETGLVTGMAWSENMGWINFSGGALASPPIPARIDAYHRRFFGYAWGENLGWINLDDSLHYVGVLGICATSDFNGDGAAGLDDDIEAFFLCLGGDCCPTCPPNGADFNGDGAAGMDQDIELFFWVLGGGACP